MLAKFILKCQDQDEGGISDQPGNMSDIFHTFFGISGLLLLKYFDPPLATDKYSQGQSSSNDNSNNAADEDREAWKAFDRIDPTYALPVSTVRRLGLASQVLPDLEIHATQHP